jgi:hypothetical protein
MLTVVQDAASVDPDALVKYFPAGHAVHDEAAEPEYVPEAHCTIMHVGCKNAVVMGPQEITNH